MNKIALAPITGGQYSLIRALLGIYLCIHFVHLMPYGKEIFSNEGILPASLSPLLGIIPNPLQFYDSPTVVLCLLTLGSAASVLLMVGKYDRIAAIVITIILGWLYARNPLIANPSLPVVGWMLVAHACLPKAPFGSLAARNAPEQWLQWHFPKGIWIAAWILLAVAYSYSGYTKLLSPSWVDGSAISLVLENPLARDHFANDLLLAMPDIVLKLLTWSVMIVELVFVALCCFSVTRKWAWCVMLLVQLGFLTFLNFADLTFPMLLIHLLTFDRRWLTQSQENNAVLFYDGECAFCNSTVKFLLAEDHADTLEYSTLNGNTFVERGLRKPVDDSIVVLTESGRELHKSDAMLFCCKSIGGVWAIMASALSIVPTIVRDSVYDGIGKIRYKLAGRVEENQCRLLPAEYSRRFLP
ncbi:MAG: DCC1-like thiol-disulfide oxidoreductase family protein [Arenicella sp.]